MSHLGSCMTAVTILDSIYATKSPEEKVILSSGHAGLALYCVIEKYGGRNAEEIFEHHGVHPDRCDECGLAASSGSLGHGIGIAVGMALSDRRKNVYCLMSDGECAEGSVWEALRIQKEQELINLHLFFNLNGYAAYQEVDKGTLKDRLWSYEQLKNNFRIYETDVEELPFLKGQQGHYVTLTEETYKQAMEILK